MKGKEMTKLVKEQIHSKDIITSMFKLWKTENANDNLSVKNATDSNAMDWFLITDNTKQIVGFYAKEKRLGLLSIVYVCKNKRHNGIAKQIVDMSECSGIQLGFYDETSLHKTKTAFKDQGYTEHRILVYRTPFANLAVGEVLAKPETSKFVPIPGFQYIDNSDKNLVRV